MKALIYCRQPMCDWPEKFFEYISPYMLPVGGKPLVEYYLDWCALSGVTELLIASPEFDFELQHFIDDGMRWGLNVTFSSNNSYNSVDDLLVKHPNFAESPLLVLDGFFFVCYDKHAEKHPLGEKSSADIYVRGAEASAVSVCPFDIFQLPDIKAFYNANMDVLRKYSGRLIMKGYNIEEGAFMGMNDVILRDSDLRAPFLMGNNVQIDTGTRIGPGAILGDACIVDKQTVIEDSIIFDNTYVGGHAELKGKILSGGKLIDPNRNESIIFADNYFSAIKRGAFEGLVRRVVEVPAALFLILIMLPFFGLFAILGLPPSRKCVLAGTKGKVRYTEYERRPRQKNAWFFKLCLDKLNLLWLVVLGRMRLVGDTVRNVKVAPRIFKRYKQYAPGVFTYADSMRHWGASITIVDDLFYKHERTIKNDTQLILRTFVVRFLTDEKADGDDEVLH